MYYYTGKTKLTGLALELNKSLFGTQTRYNLREGFPAVTTKKLAWRGITSELLWFLSGSSDERDLCQLLHGSRDKDKYLADFALFLYFAGRAATRRIYESITDLISDFGFRISGISDFHFGFRISGFLYDFRFPDLT